MPTAPFRHPLVVAALAVAIVLPSSGLSAEPAETPQAALLRAGFLANLPAAGAESTICIVDSGTNLTNDTRHAVIGRGNSVLGGSTLDDVSPHRHGTYVTTTAIGALNQWGTVGIWPSGTAHVIQASDVEIGGTGPSQQSWTAGMRECFRLDPLPTVINLSLSSETADVGQIEQEVARAHARDISVVAAAGNRGSPLDYPAKVPGVLAVAAVSADGTTRCSFSNHTPGALAAHGCGVESADPAGNPVLLQGTSFAAPQVAAILAALRAHRPDLNRLEAEALLTAHAQPGPNGLRIVDADATFRAAGLGDVIRTTSAEAVLAVAAGEGSGSRALPPSSTAQSPVVSGRGAAAPRPRIVKRSVKAIAVKIRVGPTNGRRVRARPAKLALHQNARTVILKRGARARRVGLELHGADGAISLPTVVKVPPLSRPQILRRRNAARDLLVTVRVPRRATLRVRPKRGVRRLGRSRLAVVKKAGARRVVLRIRAGQVSSAPRAVRIAARTK